MTTSQPGRRRFLWLLTAFLALLVIVLSAAVFYRGQPRATATPIPGTTQTVPGPEVRSLASEFLYAIYDIDQPLGLALSPDGSRLYVTERSGKRMVRVVDTASRALLQSLTPADSHDAPSRRPTYVAINPKGAVFINDMAKLGLSIYAPDGTYMGSLNPFAGTAQVWHPLALSFDAGGNLYVTEISDGLHRVQVFDEQNRFKFEFGKEGTGPGEFSFPNGIAVSGDGRIWVGDSNNARIQVFDPQGKLLAIYKDGGGRALAIPRSLAISSAGELVVSDMMDHSLVFYDLENPAIGSYRLGEYGSGNSQFLYPNGVAFDGQGRLYVADRENNRVLVYRHKRK